MEKIPRLSYLKLHIFIQNSHNLKNVNLESLFRIKWRAPENTAVRISKLQSQSPAARFSPPEAHMRSWRIARRSSIWALTEAQPLNLLLKLPVQNQWDLLQKVPIFLSMTAKQICERQYSKAAHSILFFLINLLLFLFVFFYWSALQNNTNIPLFHLHFHSFSFMNSSVVTRDGNSRFLSPEWTNCRNVANLFIRNQEKFTVHIKAIGLGCPQGSPGHCGRCPGAQHLMCVSQYHNTKKSDPKNLTVAPTWNVYPRAKNGNNNIVLTSIHRGGIVENVSLSETRLSEENQRQSRTFLHDALMRLVITRLVN